MTIPPQEEKHDTDVPKAEPAEAKDVKSMAVSGNESPGVKNNHGRNLWLFTLFLILAGLAWFLLWFFYLQYHEWTDDAYANGNMVNINSAISGSAVAFYADDTDLVEEGQLLVQLDPTYYQIVYDKELARLAAVVLEVRQLYDNVLAAQANVDVKQAALSKAKSDYDNRSLLVDAKAVSIEDFTHSKDDLTIAEGQLKQAEYQLKTAIDAAGNTPIGMHPRIEEQKGNVREAFYNVQHCAIYAPATGYVAQRSVEVGQWVAPSTPLMAVIPADYVWVDANYKETQLTYMRIGQPAEVWFDLYGSKVRYKGKVLGIASGTGSVFSLIPPQNATGNWIKIVQRLPVRISLDPETVKKYPTRLGISAEVEVDISNQDLPMLAQVTNNKPIAKTDVYNIQMDKVERTILRVVRSHLNSRKE